VVERFDIREGVGELEARNPDFVRRQTVEHKSVIGIGTVGNADLSDSGSSSGHDSAVLGE
jgi:hypothetical protein